MVAPLRVGIAGLGTVGAEVVRLIEAQSRTLSERSGRGVRVVAVTARSKTKKRSLDLRGVDWAKSPLALANDPNVDCFVELMGGSGEPALSAIEAALKGGKSVVTANKALIAKHGIRLAKAAEKHGGALNFEAAVGAAIPVIKTLREGLAGTGVNRVYGILNGTCNYILTRMAQVMGVTNAVTIDGEGIPPITLVGPGAGGAATASAVVADIADVARGIRAKPFGRPVARLRDTTKAPMERHEGGYYIRLMARDLAGTAATIATRLAEQKNSIESIVQPHPDGGDATGHATKPSHATSILISHSPHDDVGYHHLAADI